MKAAESMMMIIKLMRMGRKSYLKKRMDTREKDNEKQNEADGIEQSINMARRCIKEIEDNYIKPYITKEEIIWNV